MWRHRVDDFCSRQHPMLTQMLPPSRLLCDALTTIPDAEAGVFHHVGCEDVLLALGPSGSTAACALAQRGFG